MAQPDYSFLAQPLAARLDILTAQVHRILSGGPPTADSPYDKREIKLLCGQVLVSMQGEIDRLNTERLYKDALERVAYDKAQYHEDLDYIYKLGGTSDDHIVTLDEWPVLLDPYGVYYSLLPDAYVNVKRYQNLPGEEQVKSVEPVQLLDRRRRRYLPLAAGQQRLLDDLQGNFGYYRVGPRLEYYCEPGVTMPDTTVKIDFVLRPNRNQLPLPGLLQDAMDDMIIPKVVAQLLRKAPHDDKNDNNPTA